MNIVIRTDWSICSLLIIWVCFVSPCVPAASADDLTDAQVLSLPLSKLAQRCQNTSQATSSSKQQSESAKTPIRIRTKEECVDLSLKELLSYQKELKAWLDSLNNQRDDNRSNVEKTYKLCSLLVDSYPTQNGVKVEASNGYVQISCPATANNFNTSECPIYSWCPGASNCQRDIRNGETIYTIQAKGVQVSVALNDTGWKYRADVGVSNDTDELVEIYPDQFSLYSMGKKACELKYQSPEKLSSSLTAQAQWRGFLVNACAALSTSNALCPRTTSTAFVNNLGGGSSVISINTPDYSAIGRTNATANSVCGDLNDEATNVISALEARALRANTLRRGQSVSGSVFFERKRGVNMAILTLPIGQSKYVFEFYL